MRKLKNNRKILLIFIALSIIKIQSLKAEIPAAFADIGFGARPVAMGGAFVALANDANSIIWNPAGLSRLNETSATFMWTKQFNLIPYYYFAGGRPLNKTLSIGLAGISSGNDVLRENTVYLALAYKKNSTKLTFLNSLSYGLNLKFRNSSFGNNSDGGENRITGSGIGFGLDLGIQGKITKSFLIGLMLRDIVSPVSYKNETLDSKYSESIPTTIMAGMVTSVIKNMILSIDWNKILSKGNDDKINIGIEYRLLKLISLRGGFNQAIEADINRKYNLGFGFLYKRKNKLKISIDFAYEFYFLANTPKISTSIWF